VCCSLYVCIVCVCVCVCVLCLRACMCMCIGKDRSDDKSKGNDKKVDGKSGDTIKKDKSKLESEQKQKSNGNTNNNKKSNNTNTPSKQSTKSTKPTQTHTKTSAVALKALKARREVIRKESVSYRKCFLTLMTLSYAPKDPFNTAHIVSVLPTIFQILSDPDQVCDVCVCV